MDTNKKPDVIQHAALSRLQEKAVLIQTLTDVYVKTNATQGKVKTQLTNALLSLTQDMNRDISECTGVPSPEA